MIQFKYKYLKINGDVNITGNRRALAEGKEASISFHSESKCFFSFHHGDIPQNFESGLGSTRSVSRFLRLLFKLTSLFELLSLRFRQCQSQHTYTVNMSLINKKTFA